jgi:choline transport protein
MLSSEFSLGVWGYPINFFALALLLLLFVFSSFPVAPNPIPETMNWSSMVFGVVVVFSGIYYVLRARHKYVGPVEYVTRRVN